MKINMSAGIRRKLQKTPKDQFTITIPKALVSLLDWRDKDDIVFDFSDGALKIRKVRK